MVSYIRLAIIAIGLSLAAWTGYTTYNYFFSNTPPTLDIIGIEPGGSYQGDLQAIVKASDSYKVSDIAISLDGKLLVPQFRVSRKNVESPFNIPTKTLPDGKHSISVKVQNGTYHRASTTKEVVFYIDNNPLQAAFVKGDTDAKVFQGRTLHIQFQVNKPIKQAVASALSKTYECFPESTNSLIYECFIPIECDQMPNEYLLAIEITDKVGNVLTLENKFQVVMYPFKKQALTLDPAKVKAEDESGLSEKELEDKIEEITKNSPRQKLWQGAFYTPTEIKDPAKQITTQFGVMRTTQQRGLRCHKALDVYNTPKSVIWAPQNGIVVLKERYGHSGNTVVIDHGYGVLTLLFHLDNFAKIEVGDKIRKGNPVGTLGKTGYATGYHLHWEMRVNNVAIDPMQWTKNDF